MEFKAIECYFISGFWRSMNGAKSLFKKIELICNLEYPCRELVGCVYSNTANPNILSKGIFFGGK